THRVRLVPGQQLPLQRSNRLLDLLDDLPALAVPAAPQPAGAYRHHREQRRSARPHCASPAPPPFRTPPDVPATHSLTSCAGAPTARGHDAATASPVAPRS